MLDCAICIYGHKIISKNKRFNYNKNLYILLRKHAIKYIIQKIKKYILRKNLYFFSIYLLDKYYNPKSEYLLYLVNNFETTYNKKEKKIGYINNNKKLIFFKIL